MKKAVLFDMDGVLIDSEVVMLDAAIEGLGAFGIHATPEDFAPFVGAGEDAYLGNVVRKYGVDYTLAVKSHVYDVYGEKINHTYTCPRAGEIIAALTAKEIPFAICSSADKAIQGNPFSKPAKHKAAVRVKGRAGRVAHRAVCQSENH